MVYCFPYTFLLPSKHTIISLQTNIPEKEVITKTAKEYAPFSHHFLPSHSESWFHQTVSVQSLARSVPRVNNLCATHKVSSERLTPICCLKDLAAGYQSFLTRPEAGLLICCIPKCEQELGNLSGNNPKFHFLSTLDNRE